LLIFKGDSSVAANADDARRRLALIPDQPMSIVLMRPFLVFGVCVSTVATTHSIREHQRSVENSAQVFAPSATHARRADTCFVVTRRDTIRTPDGRLVSVDAASVSQIGSDVLVLGSPFYVWPGKAQKDWSLARPDSAVGFIRSRTGRITVVASPLIADRVHYPRAIALKSNKWGVFFFTTPDDTYADSITSPKATLWYGQLSVQGWSEVQPVAQLEDVVIQQRMSSAVQTRDGALAFGISLHRPWRATEPSRNSHGVILARQRGTRWILDTLHTPREPRYIKLVATPTGDAVEALIELAYFDSLMVPRPPALFRAYWDDKWSGPVMLASGIGALSHPNVFTLAGSSGGISWIAHEPRPQSLVAAFRKGTGVSAELLLLPDVHQYTVLDLTNGSTIWAGESILDHRIRLAFFHGGRFGAVDIGEIEDGFFPALAQSSQDTIVLFGIRRLDAGAGGPSAAVASTIAIRCYPTMPAGNRLP
jgi:hypothetical protein